MVITVNHILTGHTAAEAKLPHKARSHLLILVISKVMIGDKLLSKCSESIWTTSHHKVKKVPLIWLQLTQGDFID